MSLATRCPACGTVFRVVQDQLRVSEGWVRCGHCQEVFNALEGLFELGAEAPPAGPTAGPPPSASAPPGPTRTAAAASASAPAHATAMPAPEATELDLSDPGEPAPDDAPTDATQATHATDVAPDAAPDTAAHAALPSEAAPSPGAAKLDSAPSPAVPAPAPAPAQPATPLDEPISVSGLLARPDAGVPEPAAPAVAAAPALLAGDNPQADLLAGSDAPQPWPEAVAPAANAPPELDEAPSSRPFEADDDLALPLAHDEAIAMPSARLFDDDGLASSPAADPDDGGTAPPPQREWQRKRPRKPRTPVAELGPAASGGAATAPGGALAQPGFVRQAERAALWQRPGVRATLMATVGLSALLLVAQATLHFRDGLAARWPQLQPPLAQACQLVGCRLSAPRAIERISLDGSKLTSGDSDAAGSAGAGGGKRLRFAAELHNAADHRVLAPALELSFTDALGQLIARRVLLPTELGMADGTIPARSPWRVEANLDVGDLRVAGFSVEIFYP